MGGVVSAWVQLYERRAHVPGSDASRREAVK